MAGTRKTFVRGVPSESESEDFSQVLQNLDELLTGLGRTYGVTLPPRPYFTDISGVKSFCSEALDSSSTWSPWRRQVQGLGLRVRLSVLASVFLFRKTLPASKPDLEKYVELLSNGAPPPPSGFSAFVASEVCRIFPLGWDSKYLKQVWRTSLSTSSCIESNRANGGARGAFLSKQMGSFISRDEFIQTCLGLYPPRLSRKAKIMVALCDGKKRLVTVSGQRSALLSPLHQILYNWISRKEWILRGEAKPSCFVNFERKQGEVYVSGDYESATDNLNLDVARNILSEVLNRCSYVPESIRKAALDSLQSVLVTPDKREILQQRGQLMGNFLSFPLLCLQNYLAFRFFVRRKNVPVKINGDDIVFRARPEEARVWKDGVNDIGLKLSIGKTSVSSNWFSLNSTFFRTSDRGLKLVPVVRSTQLFKKIECPSAISGRLASFCLGFSDSDRRYWRVKLMRKMAPAIFSSQRSMVRGLGCRVTMRELKESGLWEREVFYLTSPREPPLPPARPTFAQNCIPPQWERVWVDHPSAADDEMEQLLMEEVLSRCWEVQPIPPSLVSTYLWDKCREGTYSCDMYLRRRISRRNARLLRVNYEEMRSYLSCTLPDLLRRKFFSTREGGLVWRCSGVTAR